MMSAQELSLIIPRQNVCICRTESPKRSQASNLQGTFQRVANMTKYYLYIQIVLLFFLYTFIIWLYLLRIPPSLQCSLYKSFIYIVATIPRESGRQPAILFFTLLGTYFNVRKFHCPS